MKIQKVTYGTMLETREIAEKTFELTKPLYCHIMINHEWYECIVPEGFISDYCSVPRVPFAYMLFGGKYNKTGTLHDALYGDWSKIQIIHSASRFYIPITKELADNILYQSLRDEGASYFTAISMYQGVNVFGGIFFKRA